MQTTTKKVLIIKTGFSETFANDKGDSVSLGDVLRTTALLHLYKDCYVVWLTSKEAIPLLVPNSYIKEVLEFNQLNVLRLQEEWFDVVINLEKTPGLCALAQSISCKDRFGFGFSIMEGRALAYRDSTEALYIASDEERKKANTKHWVELLYDMVGAVWKGEGYILPDIQLNYSNPNEIGFNYKAGHKFSGKCWEHGNWWLLEKELAGKYIINWQPTLDIHNYIRWISVNEVLVTNDSLGLHIAIGLGKKVVGLFGPTPAKEILPYSNGIMIQKEKMSDITIGEVVKCIEELLPKKN